MGLGTFWVWGLEPQEVQGLGLRDYRVKALLGFGARSV